MPVEPVTEGGPVLILTQSDIETGYYVGSTHIGGGVNYREEVSARWLRYAVDFFLTFRFGYQSKSFFDLFLLVPVYKAIDLLFN